MGGGIFLFAAVIEHWRNRYLARPGPPIVERWQMLAAMSEKLVPWERRVGFLLLGLGVAGFLICGVGKMASALT